MINKLRDIIDDILAYIFPNRVFNFPIDIRHIVLYEYYIAVLLTFLYDIIIKDNIIFIIFYHLFLYTTFEGDYILFSYFYLNKNIDYSKSLIEIYGSLLSERSLQYTVFLYLNQDLDRDVFTMEIDSETYELYLAYDPICKILKKYNAFNNKSIINNKF